MVLRPPQSQAVWIMILVPSSTFDNHNANYCVTYPTVPLGGNAPCASDNGFTLSANNQSGQDGGSEQ